MRIVCISDTHGFHDQLQLPPGDLLLHAGDVSRSGRLEEIDGFLQWLGQQDFRHKIFIAGNHDFLAEADPGLFRSLIPAGVTYLENSGVDIGGLHFWGSPITPWFFDWAFNRQRGEDIRRYWAQIPPHTDVLITHGPPYGIRDLNLHGTLTGCADLNERVWAVQPQVHLFGHIHEAYGVSEVNGTRFVNASSLDVAYQVINPPLVVELE